MSLNETVTGAETCPVCGESGSRTIYAEVKDPITLDSFRVVTCSTCDVAYTNPRPCSLDHYYPARYRGYGSIVIGILRALYNLRVSRWSRIKPNRGSVLEIGCGPGLMLAAFQQRGWRALGIERNSAAAETGRSSLGVEIVSTPIEALPADAQFDLIIMFQVLEHIGDPVALLLDCARRLAPGGRLIMNVPNFASWQSRFAGSKWLHLDVPRHLIHFTPQTLAATLGRAGLRLVEINYASLEHDPYGWVESSINRMTGRANTLTRFLMGLDPFGANVLLSFVLGAALLPFALVLSGTSWLAKRGALMEAMAVRSASVKIET